MKNSTLKLFFFILFFALTINSFSQVVSFYKQYADITDVVFLSIDTTHDGGYISCGRIKNSIGGNYFVIKVDSLGNEQWRRKNTLFNQLDSDNVMNSVKELPEHTYIMCGDIDHDFPGHAGTDHQNYIVKLDSVGNLMWEKILGDTFQEFSQDISVYSDNSFIVIGVRYVSPANISLQKFNSLGDSLWYKEYTFPTSNGIAKNIIKKCLNSDCVILSELSNSYNGITRIDSSGNILDSSRFSFHNIAYPLFIGEYAPYKYEAITGNNSPPYFSKFIKLDSSFSIFYDTVLPQLFSATILDSNIVYGSVPDLYVYKGNSTGDTLWEQYINEPYGEPAVTIISRDGCAVTCGNIDDGNNTIGVGFILKVCDSSFVNSDILPIQNNNIFIYPNPFDSFVEIKLNPKLFNDSDFLEVRINNMTGELCRKFLLSTPDFKIDRNNLISGTYTLSIYNKNIKIITRKLIIK